MDVVILVLCILTFLISVTNVVICFLMGSLLVQVLEQVKEIRSVAPSPKEKAGDSATQPSEIPWYRS